MFQPVFISVFLLLFVNVSNSDTTNPRLDDKPLEFSKLEKTKLNCFGMTHSLFLKTFEKFLGHKTKVDDIRYYFYSRSVSGNVTVYANKEFNITDLPYKSNLKTVVITHGFFSRGTVDWVQDMKDAFLKWKDVNVIVVDWHKDSNTWNYQKAADSAELVGAELAKLLRAIKTKTLATSPHIKAFGSLYLVGHSLGAHISAHTSYVLRKLDENDNIKLTIERITGLDPAEPCFDFVDNSLKLDRSDAEYVDVIHTNVKMYLNLGIGLPDRLGHADYYPDGGHLQLGCKKINTAFWNFLLLPIHIVEWAICSHGRSHELFIDSIHASISGACHFQGHKWNRKYENLSTLIEEGSDDVYPEMGINSIKYHPSQDGVYFVPTGATQPYCRVTASDRENLIRQLEKERRDWRL